MAKMIARETAEMRVLPSVSRAELLHSPLDTMGRGAQNIMLTGESARIGANAVLRASRDMEISRNASNLRLDGSTPLPERFQNLLNALG